MLALLAAFVAAACDSSSVQAPVTPTPVATVEVSAPSTNVMVGQQLTLVATPKSTAGEPLQRPVTWSSQNMQIATVSSAGVVTAITPGAVNIVATSESRTGVAAITVTAASPAPVAEVRLNVDDEVLLEWNGTTQLSAVALDAQGAELPGRSVQWQTSKPAIATVSDNGSVQAVAAGIATITAIIEGVASNVGVRVKTAPVAEVVLEVPASASALEVGETVFVGTRVKLASGQLVERAMTWTSSNSAVATASSSAPVAAAVEAHAAGDVTLTAAIEGKSASITLRVTPKPTHDLIYNRWNAQNASEIFILPLDVAGGVPVRLNAGNVSRDPSPSPDGTRFVFAVSQIDPLGRDQNDLYIVNRDGQNMRQLTSMQGVEDEPMWSPDGTKILFRSMQISGEENSLWTVNVDGTGLTKLTIALPGGATDPGNPTWSPNGSRIAFTATRDFVKSVWTMNADGSNMVQVTTDAGFDMTPTWAPAGDRIAFSRYNAAAPQNGWDIMIVNAAGGTPVRLTLPGDQLVPAWSPDGHYIAVTGTAVAGQGTQNLYTMRPDGTGLRLRTVNPAWGGGTAPAWVNRR